MSPRRLAEKAGVPKDFVSRPLAQNDERYLKKLLLRAELADVRPVIEHLLKRRLKLEQEAF